MNSLLEPTTSALKSSPQSIVSVVSQLKVLNEKMNLTKVRVLV